MVGTHIYQNITRLAESLGFAACGVAAACRLEEESEHYLSAMKEGCFAEMEYLKRNCEKREDPRLLFEGAKSILAFLAPYGDESATPEKEVIFGNGTCGRYKIAQYALGEDYHRIIKEKLSAILNYIKSRIPEARGRVYTDTAPIMERAWGVRAGLGFIGKNNFLISRSAGIRNFIGIIITDVEFEPVFDMSQYKNHCGECRRCIEHGFNSVMIDKSSASIEENIAKTREVVEYAKKFGVCVEAELGHVPDAIPGTGESAMNPEKISDVRDTLTKVSDVERFVAETGVDALAVAIGTAHGTYISAPKLDIDRLSQINAASKAALVLHGGSGTPESELKAAIAAGISKINVYTDLVTAYNLKMKENYAAMTNMGTWPVINSVKPVEAMREKAAAYIKMFGSEGRA